MSSMTTTNILDAIDLWVPHSLTDAQVVVLLNSIQDELFRKMQFPNSIATKYPYENVDTYTLPTGCQPDRIVRLYLEKDRHVINATELTAYVGETDDTFLSLYDLDGDDDIDSADSTMLTTMGGEKVVSDGTVTEYDYTDLIRPGTTQGYRYTIVTDNKVRITPVPTVRGGSVSGISVIDGGSAFTSAPSITLTGNGTLATATATVSGGAVTVIALDTIGINYSYPPLVSASGGGGSGLVASSSLNRYRLVFEYQPNPTAFDSSDLTITPSIPSDYDYFMVWETGARIAKMKGDTELANNMQREANALLDRMIRDFSHKPAPGFQQEWSW